MTIMGGGGWLHVQFGLRLLLLLQLLRPRCRISSAAPSFLSVPLALEVLRLLIRRLFPASPHRPSSVLS